MPTLEISKETYDKIKDQLGEDEKIDPLRKPEVLLLNVNSAKTVGMITNLGKGIATFNLKIPICAAVGDKITISRR